MAVVFLLLLVSGIGLSQAASSPAQVTLRWLRLGGIIALALGAVAATIALLAGEGERPVAMAAAGAALLPVVVQLATVQLGWRRVQRAAGAISWLVAGVAAAFLLGRVAQPNLAPLGLEPPAAHALVVSSLLSAGLLGGFLMTMLLGHAFLTAGNEMTQAPFLRLVRVLGALLALRAAAALWFGLLPWWSLPSYASNFDRTWVLVMISARLLVGLAVPAVLTWMSDDCVRRHANQSATGILYVTSVMVVLGEGAALGLIGSTGVVF